MKKLTYRVVRMCVPLCLHFTLQGIWVFCGGAKSPRVKGPSLASVVRRRVADTSKRSRLVLRSPASVLGPIRSPRLTTHRNVRADSTRHNSGGLLTAFIPRPFTRACWRQRLFAAFGHNSCVHCGCRASRLV